MYLSLVSDSYRIRIQRSYDAHYASFAAVAAAFLAWNIPTFQLLSANRASTLAAIACPALTLQTLLHTSPHNCDTTTMLPQSISVRLSVSSTC